MKHFFILFTIACGWLIPATAQRLEIISMDHIGGNKTDQILPPGVLKHPNGNFSVTVSHNSTTGSLKTDCSSFEGGMLMLTYDANYTGLIGQYCAPIGTGFSFFTFHIYPQPNGDTILIGVRDTAGRSYDIGIERRNAAGNVLWTKFYGGTGSDNLAHVAPASDGGFFIAASSASTDGDVGFNYDSVFLSLDTWILRLDNNGDIMWSKVIGGTGTDLVREVHAASDGGCYVFGVTTSDDFDATGNHGGADLYVVRLDSQGNKVWQRCYGGSGDDGSGYNLGIKALPDGQGGYYVLNRTTSQDGDVQQRLPDEWPDFWLLHIDSAGAILWENTFGGPYHQDPYAFCRGADGSLWMAGEIQMTEPGGQVDVLYGSTDGWVLHADTSGNLLGQRVLGGNQEDALNMLHPLPDGTVLAGGRYRTNSGDRSPGFPQATEGESDIYLAHLSPNTLGTGDKDAVAFDWDMYPNPASGKVTIKVNTPGAYQLKLTTATGQQVYAAKLKASISLNTNAWAPGIYLVTLSSKQGSSSRKLSIQPK